MPFLRFNVQSAAIARPFWTSAYLSSASTSNPPRLLIPFGLQHTFSPLQRPICRACSSVRLPFSYGPEGSRTPVRKPIPCSSTIIVDCLTFPPVHGNQHPCTFSSFMIRPASQSFDTVVSYMFEAWVLKCRCFKSDCCN